MSEWAVRSVNCSHESGCNSGSTNTLWYVSQSNWAVMSLISLWRRDGSHHAYRQLKACSTVNLFPHVHSVGRWDGWRPYQSDIASWNALLCNEKPCSSIGGADNQLDAPFSLANSIAWLRGPGNSVAWVAASFHCCYWQKHLTSFLICYCSQIVSREYSCICWRIYTGS